MSWTVAIGVDTHKETHSASAFDRLGRRLGRLEIASTSGGYLELLAWAESLGEPAFAIEGAAIPTGAGLARVLAAAGRPLFEVERPKRAERRAGKSDPLDADRAAGRLLASEGLSQLRGGGERETLRALPVERRSAQQARLTALNQLQALLVTAPAPLRERLRGRRAATLVETCSRLRPREPHAARLAVVLRRLAGRIRHLDGELHAIDQTLEQLIAELAPEPLAEYGVGPLAASSGKTQRHRLNRGGDRHLNYALHVIALHRIRFHDETRVYQQHLLDRGKNKREAMRCIKRALARRLYRILIANPKLHYATT